MCMIPPAWYPKKPIAQAITRTTATMYNKFPIKKNYDVYTTPVKTVPKFSIARGFQELINGVIDQNPAQGFANEKIYAVFVSGFPVCRAIVGGNHNNFALGVILFHEGYKIQS